MQVFETAHTIADSYVNDRFVTQTTATTGGLMPQNVLVTNVYTNWKTHNWET